MKGFQQQGGEKASTLRVGVDLSICAFNNAGNARYSRHLLAALQARAETERITFVPLVFPGFLRAHRAGIRRRGVTLLWETLYAPFLLPALCRHYGLDLLHATVPMPASGLPCPLVTTVHDCIPFFFPEWFAPVMGARLRRWLRIAVGESDHLIANSCHTARDLRRMAPARAQDISVIYPASFLPVMAEDGLRAREKPPGGRYILSVGTLEPRKNLALVLEAYARLVSGREAPDLIVAGGAGWLTGDLRDRLMQLGLTERVHLAGYVSDTELQRLYAGASMLVYPSRYEGFGFPLLEAMSSGCPVIGSTASSMPEVVGEAGLLVDPDDAAALAAAMELLLADPERADELRRRGLEQARRFSWEQCAESTVAVYRQTIDMARDEAPL